jgi:hypothetical protein
MKVAPITETIMARVAQKNIPSKEEVISSGNLNAYPNPFTDQVNISFTLQQTQPATLKLYDSQGRELSTLYQGKAEANIPQQVQWKPTDQQAAGLYIIKLQTPSRMSHQKVIFSR